ncbi:MAG: hypothetical protein AABY88_06340 [Pseudomonadota bacterium]
MNRALRATALIVFGWVGLRTSFVLMSTSAEISAPVTRPIVGQSEAALSITTAVAENRAIMQSAMARRTLRNIKIRLDKTKSEVQVAITGVSKTIAQESADVQQTAPTRPGVLARPLLAVPSRLSEVPLDDSPRPRRLINLNVSAWAILRPVGSGANLATNGQLGASQAGVRFQQPLLRIGQQLPVTLNLRASTPLDQRLGHEAGIGLGVRPVKLLPVELILERRVAFDRGGRNAFAVIAAGGFDDKQLGSKASLSGYAQGGIVGFAQKDGFIDGSLRIERALFDSNHTGLRLGAGLWGAAQPHVARIDVGPIVAVKQRLGSTNLRVSAEYRWRVAGHARPASGPAVSIGADF